MKAIISVILIVFLTLARVIVDFVTYSYEIIMDPNYWIETVFTQIPIVIIIFVMRSLFKDRESKQNDDIKKSKERLDAAYATIHTSVSYLASFKDYIARDNRKRKLDAYKGAIETKLLALATKITKTESVTETRKHKREMTAQKKSLLTGREVKADENNPFWILRLHLLTKRLARLNAKRTLYTTRRDHAEEIIDYVKVKYSEVSYANLFTDNERASADNKDLYIHEQRDVSALLGTKVLGVAAFGILSSSTIIFNVTGTAFEIVYAIVFSILQTALAIYTGATSGTMFVRTEVALRLKLRVAYLQEFFAREREIEVRQ